MNAEAAEQLAVGLTQVARYRAFPETAGGFTLPTSQSSDRHIVFSLPGAIALPAVIFHRSHHVGKPAFSIRISDFTATQYTFVASDEAERTWHEVIPASTGLIDLAAMLLTVAVTTHAVAHCCPRLGEGSMGKLIYAANISLDGFLEDETGSFDWSVPDEDMHAFWNEHERRIGTSLYRRGMYETMRVWASDDSLTSAPPVVREYAGIWRDADKVVYSTSLAG